MANLEVGVEVKAIADGVVDAAGDLLVSFVLMPKPLTVGSKGIVLSNWPEEMAKLAATFKLVVRNSLGGQLGNPIGLELCAPPAVPSWAKVNAFWRAVTAQSDEFGPPDGKIAEALKPELPDKPGLPDIFRGPIFSSPATNLSKLLTMVDAVIPFLQAVRFLGRGGESLAATRALNPMSSQAMQSAITATLFGTGAQKTIRQLRKEAGERDKTSQSLVVDALRRIAWTGRRTPKPRIAFLAGSAGGKAPENNREYMYAEETVDEAEISGNLEAGVTKAIQSGIALDNSVGEVVSSDKSDTTGLEAYSELIGAFSRSDKKIGGFADWHRPYEFDPTVVMGKLSHALNITEQTSEKVMSGDRETDPTAALAAYELAMMPDRAAFQETLVANKIDPSLFAALAPAATEPEAGEQPAIVRRLVGLLAYPDVARLFGLIVDVKLEREKLTSVLGGETQDGFMIEAAHESGFDIKIIPSVSRLDADTFEPQSLYANIGMTKDYADLSDGHLLLGMPGYEVVTVDVNAALEGSVRAARNDQNSLEHGEFVTAVESPKTTQRTAGVALNYRHVVYKGYLDQLVSQYRLSLLEKGSVGPVSSALYLEDLVAGYRIDVGTAKDSRTEWRSLTNRSVAFPQIEALGIKLDADHCAMRERMNGYVRAVHREYDAGTGTETKPIAASYETLATWRNWSLAVPAKAQTRPICEDDLRLETVISLPRVANNLERLPNLEFGSEYSFGARFVLINGSSISRIKAEKNYTKDDGRPWTIDGFKFRRHEPVAAPTLFYRDTIDKSNSNNEVKGYGEALSTIVVGTNSAGEGKSAERYLLAGSQPFDICQLHGVFKGLNTLPKSSYLGVKTEPPIEPPETNANERVYDDRKIKKKTGPYYVDPAAELMIIGFYKDGELVEAPAYPEPLIIDLFSDGRKWPNPRPILLRVERVDSAGPHEGSSQRAAIKVRGGAAQGWLTVTIGVEPAEIVEVRAWCVPRNQAGLDRINTYSQMLASGREFLKYFETASSGPVGTALAEMFTRAAQTKLLSTSVSSLSTDPVTVETGSLYDRLLVSIPLHGISHALTMEVIHAVEKPLKPPRIRNLWTIHEQLPAAEIAEAANTGPNDMMLQSWRDFIDANSLSADSVLSEQLRRLGKEGSQRVLIGGSVEFHRRSTSSLEVNGIWDDYTKDLRPRLVGSEFMIGPESKVLKLESRNQLENIPYEILNEPEPGLFDLVFTPIHEKRLLFHEFAGTHAKRIKFTTTAISRFAKHFKGSKKLEVRSDGNSQWTLVIPSTRRPDKVLLDSVSSALHESGGRIFDIQGAGAGRSLLPLDRKVMIRLDLGVSWYSSGEDEKLGVVLWPPDLVDTPSAHKRALKSQVNGIPDFATCWGRDPVRLTGDVPRLLLRSSIANCTSYARAMVPVPPEDRKSGESVQSQGVESSKLGFVECVLALFKPLVDPDTGHFYVDVEIDAGNSYNAFVRFGLVRYQSESLSFGPEDNLEVSIPIRKQVSIMPARKLGCRLAGNESIIFNFSGVGYSQVNAGLLDTDLEGKTNPDWQAALDKLQTTTIDVVALWRSHSRDYSGVPLRPVTGSSELAELVDVPPTVAGPGFLNEWEFQIDFVKSEQSCPTCRERRQLVIETPNEPGNVEIVIREYEHYPADRYADDITIDEQDVSPFPEKYNTRLIKRVVSSFTVDLELDNAKNVQVSQDSYDGMQK